MKTYFADLHVHIGRGQRNQPVKIAASSRLTLDAIIDECTQRKGIHIVGIVDAVCTSVLPQLELYCETNRLIEHVDGGLQTKDKRLTIIPGAELEIRTGGKAAHYLAYFGRLQDIKTFQEHIKPHITNLSLSSQVVRIRIEQLIKITKQCNGIFVFAHAFTPHKGYFGHCADTLAQCFNEELISCIDAIELGLSADTSMALALPDLHEMPFLSSSDAHSLATIAREYTAFLLQQPTFKELQLALQETKGRRITAYYGLDPRLGKYYRTFCRHCQEQVPLHKDRLCTQCERRIVPGVYDRLIEIAGQPDEEHIAALNDRRPPYVHQIPLHFIPGLGPVGLKRLEERIGTHMHVLHNASYDELIEVIGQAIADRIMNARRGKLQIHHGAGGHYGRVQRGD